MNFWRNFCIIVAVLFVLTFIEMGAFYCAYRLGFYFAVVAWIVCLIAIAVTGALILSSLNKGKKQ